MARQVLTYPDIPPVLTQAAADTRYALVAHNHDAAYATVAHLHTGVYLPVAHEPGVDPHTQYYNQTRGDARYLQTTTAASTYSPLGHLHTATYVDTVGDTMTGPLILNPAASEWPLALNYASATAQYKALLGIQRNGSSTWHLGLYNDDSLAVYSGDLNYVPFRIHPTNRTVTLDPAAGQPALITRIGSIRQYNAANTFYESWVEAPGTHTNGFYWGLNSNGDWVLNRRNAGADLGPSIYIYRTTGVIGLTPSAGYGAIQANMVATATGPQYALRQQCNPGAGARMVDLGMNLNNQDKWMGLGVFDNAGGHNLTLVNGILGGVGANIEFYPYGGSTRPGIDNSWNFGDGTHRWVYLFAAQGAINTSLYEAKEAFAPLDPASCAAAVLETDWVGFDYKLPNEPEWSKAPDDQPEMKAVAAENLAKNRANHQASVAATEFARHQKGYVLQSPTHKVSEMFGLPDRKSGSVGSDLAVVACALQHCLLEIAELKARLA